jgi:two-component system, NarL family, nitrate/nitrite response regulator NarL
MMHASGGDALASAEPVRVLIVATVRLYREGLVASLETHHSLTVVGAAADLVEASRLVGATHPDVVVVDMSMPDGLGIVEAIGRDALGVKIIAFAIEESDLGILACAGAGVAGYLPCDGSTDDLVAIIEKATCGEAQCSPRMAALLFRRLASLVGGGHNQPVAAILTLREQEIADLIHDGLSNKEIAVRLTIEVATVKNHVHNILEKLQVNTRTEAAARLHGGPPRRPSLSAAGRS